MSEPAKSSTAKVKKLSRQFLNEIGATGAGDLRCIFATYQPNVTKKLSGQLLKK